MGHKAPSTPVLILKLPILTLTHFHSSKALYSDSEILTIPGSRDPEMGGYLWCVPARNPGLISLDSTLRACEANSIFLVLGLSI